MPKVEAACPGKKRRTKTATDDEIPGQTTFQATALTIEESKDPEARITKMPCKRGTWFRES
jgi:hypothetical protein